MEYQTLRIERHGEGGHVAVLYLNRPEVLNAINTQMGKDLLDAFHRLRHDRELRCLVVTGAGDRAFSVGGDLKERQGMTDDEWLRQHRIFEEVTLALLAVEAPVIAAIEGFCMGGGFETALGTDFLVAAENAVFALPEVRRGILPGGGATQFLPRLIGVAATKELIFTGRRFTAAEAYERGIITVLTPPGQALARALELATTIAANAPIAVRQVKKAIDRGSDMDLRTGLAFAVEAYNVLVPTEDRREGVRAFNEKREPRFQNR